MKNKKAESVGVERIGLNPQPDRDYEPDTMTQEELKALYNQFTFKGNRQIVFKKGDIFN